MGAREESETVFSLSNEMSRGEIPRLCDRVREVLESGYRPFVICDADGVTEPDAVAVDAVARMQLTAIRLGSEVRLRGACPELRDLIEMAGLSEVIPLQGS